jgi:hypothetical protein
MKNFLISNFVISFIISFNFSFSQELPEIPMKNGMAYYSFEHKLDNKSKCLSAYMSPPSSAYFRKISNYTLEFNTEISKAKNGAIAIMVGGKPSKCHDTVGNISALQVTLVNFKKWQPLVSKLILATLNTGNIKNVTASVYLVFTSKNEYKLIVKDLIISTNNGLNKFVKIGELYSEIKNSGNVTKQDVKFFEDLNFFIKSTDEIIFKALTDAYKADEL